LVQIVTIRFASLLVWLVGWLVGR